MLQTAIVRVRVTRENIDDLLLDISARDQRREIIHGDVISHYHDDDIGEMEAEVTIWHNLDRAAVCAGNGDSAWGAWDERTQTIALDEPDANGDWVLLNRYGRPRQ